MSPDSITDTKWTYSKMLKELPAESRYELRNNELIDMSSPSEIHQQIVFRLTLIIGSFIVNNKLGKFYTSPLDVIFDEGTVMQPDLIFVAQDHKSIIKEKGIFGAPDVLIEIVSKSSIQRDYIDKKQDYERFGVQEYWIVDPMYQTASVYTLVNNKYSLFSTADGEETFDLRSGVLEDLVVNWKDVFGEG